MQFQQSPQIQMQPQQQPFQNDAHVRPQSHVQNNQFPQNSNLSGTNPPNNNALVNPPNAQSRSPPESPTAQPFSLFGQDQQLLLRNQFLAFKSLFRTKVLPQPLQGQIFNPTVSSAFQVTPAPFSNTPSIQNANLPQPQQQQPQQHINPQGQPPSRIPSAGIPTPQQIPPRIPSTTPDSPNLQRNTPSVPGSSSNSPRISRRKSKTPSSPAPPRASSTTPVNFPTSQTQSQQLPLQQQQQQQFPSQISSLSPQQSQRQIQQQPSSPQGHLPQQTPSVISPHQTPSQIQRSQSQISSQQSQIPPQQVVAPTKQQSRPAQTIKHGKSATSAVSLQSQRPPPSVPSPSASHPPVSSSGVLDNAPGSNSVPPTPTAPVYTPPPPPPPPKTNLEKLGVSNVVDIETIISEPVDISDMTPISDKVPFIPSLMPLGIDIEHIKTARENDINRRIFNRLVDLSTVIGDVSKNGNKIQEISNSDEKTTTSTALTTTTSNISDEMLDNLIEFKALKLLNKQKSLRGDILADLYYFNSVAMNEHNQIHFTRMKQQTLNEAYVTEQFDLSQRAERAQRENQMKRNHIKAMCAHSKEIRASIITREEKRRKFGRSVMSFHSYTEKEEQKRAERTARQRLQALKANDEEAYIKLLDQTKDTRITHLLRQTNSFLDSLAQAVKNQQRESRLIETDADEDQDPDELEQHADDDDDDDWDEDKEKVDYHAVAHRIKEVVTKQPSILVGGTLKEYQLKGLQWMISLYNNNLNGILADEMGLGKTIQTISLITYLIEVKHVPGPYLVIVPLSTLTNWTLEFERWAPSVKKVVYKGPPVARKVQQAIVKSGDFQVVLTTFEYVIKDRPILSKIKWVHMIIDEGHRMKNANSKLSYTLTTYYSSKYRLILTGTPLQNNLPELWALLNFALPKIFNSVKSFDEWFNTPFANTGSQDKMDLSEEETLLIIRRLHKVLRPFLLRRLKKEVEKDLPDKVEKVIKCKMSALQASLYQQVLRFKKMLVSSEGNSSGGKSLNNKLMQLKKVCNHPFVFEQVESLINPTKQNNALLWRSAGKFELLDRVLPKFKATNHRVLIFFQMTQIMDIMEDFLLVHGFKYLRLDGGTKADERSDLLRKFNAPDSPYFAFLLSTRAGGLGLNLQTADTVIIFDTDWNPHQDLQAQDRAHRIGQTKEVRILRLITENSVEETILDRAHQKLDIDGKVIQAGKFDNKSTNEEQEAFLRRLLEQEEQKRLHKNDEEEELDDDELNEILARNDGERELFRKIDEERNAASPYGKDKKLDRLMSESELPDIYKEESLNKESIDPEPVDTNHYGRGARERKVMHYDDGLTEEQWVEAIDADNDTPEEATARKRARIEKRRANKLKREQGKTEGGGSPRGFGRSRSPSYAADTPSPTGGSESRSSHLGSASSAPPSGVKRKRGRRPRAEIEAAAAAAAAAATAAAAAAVSSYSSTMGVSPSAPSAALSDAILPPIPLRRKGKGRPPKVKETLSQGARMDLTYKMRVLYEHVMGLKDNDGRHRIYLFKELPSKRLYATYYTIIENPIAMDIINKRINNNTYQKLGEFRADFKLMFDNARRYNEEGSQVYEDANIMEREFNEKLEELVPGIFQLPEPETPANTGEAMTPTLSSSVTTPASVPHIGSSTVGNTTTTITNDGGAAATPLSSVNSSSLMSSSNTPSLASTAPSSVTSNAIGSTDKKDVESIIHMSSSTTGDKNVLISSSSSTSKVNGSSSLLSGSLDSKSNNNDKVNGSGKKSNNFIDDDDDDDADLETEDEEGSGSINDIEENNNNNVTTTTTKNTYKETNVSSSSDSNDNETTITEKNKKKLII